MASYNKIIMMGNLTRDPELSYLPSQMPVVSFGIAVNEKWKDKDGQAKEKVCFVDCVAFGKTGETINQWMKKGKPILIEGKLVLDQWEDQSGQKRNKHKINVERFTFINDGQQELQGGNAPQRPPQAPPQQQPPAAPPYEYKQQGPPSDLTKEDIPF